MSADGGKSGASGRHGDATPQASPALPPAPSGRMPSAQPMPAPPQVPDPTPLAQAALPDDESMGSRPKRAGTASIRRGAPPVIPGTGTLSQTLPWWRLRLQSGHAPNADRATIIWLVVAMALATAPFLDRLPPWLTACLAGLAAWRLHPGLSRHPLPRWLRLSIIPVLLGLLALTGNLSVGLDGAAPFFVAFLWLKLIELRARRDVLMACFLCYFLVAGNLLASQSLLASLWSAVSAMAVTATALRAHAAEAAWPTARTAGLFALQGLPLALVFFLFAPRPPLHLAYQTGGKAVTGVSDVMRPGDVARLSQSQEVAFRVEFPQGAPAEREALYWRGPGLWATDGKQWTRGLPRRQGGALPSGRAAGPDGVHRQPLVQEITLSPTGTRWAFALDCPVQVEPSLVVGPDAGLELEYPAARAVTYRVASRTDLRPGDPLMLLVASALRLPRDLDPRVTALGRDLGGWARVPSLESVRVAAAAEDAAFLAEAGAAYRRAADGMLAWFGRNGFRYTLEPGLMGESPVGEFLYVKKAGFCAHYAGAFATVLRAAGVPTRVIIGYKGAEPHPAGYLVVRQSMAHAWCEVWTPDRGWQRYDPTDAIPGGAEANPGSTAASASRAAAAAANEGWWGALRRRTSQSWDLVEARWDRWALSYDLDRQFALAARLGLGSLGHAGIWLLLAVGLAAAIGAAWLLVSRRARPPTEVRLWLRLCARCRARGCAREAWEGPTAFAERAAAVLPERAAAIRAGAEAYSRLRYAPRADRAGAMARLRSAVRSM